MAKEKDGPSRTRWYVLAGVAVVLIGVVAAYVATRGDNDATTKAAAAVTTVPAAKGGPTCPLTGAPAPGGVVPARPALGVKIGNYPGDRPSAGLNQADIVFEEPVEGAITRLLAVFQCTGASLVGDLRSAREPDIGILSQLSNPLFVHAGGIDPDPRPPGIGTPPRRQSLYGGPRFGHHHGAGPGGALRHLRQHRLVVGIQHLGHHSLRPPSSTTPWPCPRVRSPARGRAWPSPSPRPPT